MTKLLAEAFGRASLLPEDGQDELARDLPEDLAWEGRREKTLADSRHRLDDLAEKAVADHRARRTEQAGFDELRGHV